MASAPRITTAAQALPPPLRTRRQRSGHDLTEPSTGAATQAESLELPLTGVSNPEAFAPSKPVRTSTPAPSHPPQEPATTLLGQVDRQAERATAKAPRKPRSTAGFEGPARTQVANALQLLEEGELVKAWGVLHTVLGHEKANLPESLAQVLRQVHGAHEAAPIAEQPDTEGMLVVSPGSVPVQRDLLAALFHLVCEARNHLAQVEGKRLGKKEAEAFKSARHMVLTAVGRMQQLPEEWLGEPSEEEPAAPEDSRCGARHPKEFKARCALPSGHEGEHEASGPGFMGETRYAWGGSARKECGARPPRRLSGNEEQLRALKGAVCTRNSGHEGLHEDGLASARDGKPVQWLPSAQEDTASADGEQEEPAAASEAEACLEACPLPGQGRHWCGLPLGHEMPHEAEVPGEPPLTWHPEDDEESAVLVLGDGPAVAREKEREQARNAAKEEPAEHTPGPWEVRMGRSMGRPGTLLVTTKDGEEVLAVDAQEDPAGATADAQLVAAAPDMKEFLVMLRGRLLTGQPLKPEQMQAMADEVQALLLGAGVEVRS